MLHFRTSIYRVLSIPISNKQKLLTLIEKDVFLKSPKSEVSRKDFKAVVAVFGIENFFTYGNSILGHCDKLIYGRGLRRK